MLEDDGDERDDSKRKTRNLSEKKRRDQFNMLVNELNAMISSSNRKMDKSTVLKSTISFLKNHNEIAVRSRVNEIQEDWKPSFLSNEEFTHLILEALDGFIMVVSSSGKINYASESITSLLGHLPSDLLNTSIFDITFDDDKSPLFNLLQNSTGPGCVKDDNNQVVFSSHLKRGCLDYREGTTYELVQFTGYFRTNEDSQDVENCSIFVCTGRLQTPQLIRDMSVVDSSKSEFTSRHSLEWKFLFLDHRAPPIIGYLPFEVLGTSGYDYYHFDDLDKVVTCHEALMQKGEGTSCYYRFLTKGQQWIWLQTRFYITYHQWNSKPEFVVCTHRVVSYQDVIKSMHKDLDQGSQHSNAEGNRFYENQSNKYMHETTQVQHNLWRKRSSKSKYSATSDHYGYKKSYNKRSHTTNSSRHGSDTASISADSLTSKQSILTHQSSSSVSMQTGSCVVQAQQRCQMVMPQPQPQPHHSQQLTVLDASQLQQVDHPCHPDLQVFPSVADQHMHQFPETPQYLAVPVPSVITFPTVQPISAASEIGIMITPNQAQMQEQLQKKHEELKQMIRMQQEELRRVSEQLVMARYGLLPPLINVSVPYNGILQAGANPMWNENVEAFASGPLPHQPVLANQPNPEQQMAEDNSFTPMQMSQNQAQLLFSSTDGNQHLDRTK